MRRRGFLAAVGACSIGGCLGARAAGPIYAKVDLHAHIYHDGHEGADPAATRDTEAMVQAYEDLGYDVLVGTDHHYDVSPSLPGNPEAEEVINYQGLDFDGPILNGIELSAGPHVNLIRSENEEIRQINHPQLYGANRAQILTLADRVGADLVEVTSGGGGLAGYPSPSDVVEDLPGLRPTMTSDAHSVEALREKQENHVVVEVPELTGDAVIRALKRGDYSLSSAAW